MSRGQALLCALIVLSAATPARSETDGVQISALDTGGIEARAAALLLSGQEGGDLPAALLAVPLAAGGASRLALVVEIGADAFGDPSDSPPHLIEIYAYALDPQGGVKTHLTQAFTLGADRAAELPAEGGVLFSGHLELPPGHYSLRALVLQRQSGRFRLLGRPVRIPERPADSWNGDLAPLFPAEAGLWLQVDAAGSAEGTGIPPGPEGRAWFPSARPRLSPGSPARFYLALPGPPVRLRARILDLDRLPIWSAHVEPVAVADRKPGEPALWGADLPPFDLEPGDYVLELSAAGREGASSVHVPFTFGSRLVEGDDSSAAAAPSAIEPAEIAAAYLESLRRLAAHQRAEARSAIIRIESSQVEGGDEAARERLAGVLMAVASFLAAGEPEGLVPLIQLHEELFRRYHAERRFLLAAHSRRLVSSLLVAYSSSSRSADSRQVAACALVSLAGYLLESNALATARTTFEQALEHDGRHPGALLGLAVIDEALGEHRSASEVLRRLLESRPGSGEARLRLALNLRRLGSEQEAEELLRAIISPAPGLEPGEGEEWVEPLARQELARLLTKQGRTDEAESLLRLAIERWPSLERLYIQLAAVLDRQQRPLEARSLLERIAWLPRWSGETPRLRYSGRPAWSIEEARRFLDDAAGLRIADLAGSLAFAPSEGE